MLRGKKIIEITTTACSKLYSIAHSENVSSILFRIKGGGCNGFNYILEPTDENPQKLDEVIERPGYKLIICNSSLIHILGTKIDWKKDIMGEGFNFENPMAAAKCGCGTSFTSKNFS